jgi:hypothetical protein
VITETRLPAAFPSRVGRPAIRCFIDLAVHPHFASDSAFFASQGRKLYFFTTLYVDVKERALGKIESRRVGEASRGPCGLVSLRQRMTTPAPRAVDAWVFRVSLCGLQLARKMVFKFTEDRPGHGAGSSSALLAPSLTTTTFPPPPPRWA